MTEHAVVELVLSVIVAILFGERGYAHWQGRRLRRNGQTNEGTLVSLGLNPHMTLEAVAERLAEANRRLDRHSQTTEKLGEEIAALRDRVSRIEGRLAGN